MNLKNLVLVIIASLIIIISVTTVYKLVANKTIKQDVFSTTDTILNEGTKDDSYIGIKDIFFSC
jgi:hypothetical protein